MKTIMTLTSEQFCMVYDGLSLTIVIMGAFALFCFFSRSQVAPKFRSAILIIGLVTLVSCYHYFKMFAHWNNAFEFAGVSYAASGNPFHESHRYVDWLLAMPLLLVSFLSVLPLSKQLQRWLLRQLIPASLVMILSGYFAKLTLATHHGVLTTLLYCTMVVAFVYIMRLLWKNLTPEFRENSLALNAFFLKVRRFILLSWLAYPLLDLLGSLPFMASAPGLVAITIGYSLADIIAQCGLGLFVYQLACLQSEEHRENNF